MSRHTSLSIEESIKRLRRTSELVHCRNGVKAHEERRIKDAIATLNEHPDLSATKTAERRQHYRHFLSQIVENGGRQLVILCAIGLGQSAVAAMKEANRLLLPQEIRKHKAALQKPILQTLEARLWNTDHSLPCTFSSYDQAWQSF
jgi:hypothetical protein